MTVPYAACIQLYPPEDEHLRLETCTGEEYTVLTQAVYRQPPQTVTVPYAACIQLYPPEDGHLMLETCTGE